jgi:hypothetical protein
VTDWEPTWDLTTVPAKEFNSEAGRRRGAYAHNKPKVMRPCVGCGLNLGAREQRQPCVGCGVRQPKAKRIPRARKPSVSARKAS